MTSSHNPAGARSAGILSGSLTDLRHARRLLWKSNGITATTLLTLALGIGATTAIFSTVYSLMLKPLPYREPERIVELYTSASKAGLHRMPANIPFYLDYSRNATSYESLGLWQFFYSLVGEKDAVVRTPGVRMTAEIFSILRIQPLLGTFFTAVERYLAQHVADAQVRKLPGAGHFAPVLAPEAVAGALVAFLDSALHRATSSPC